MSRNGFLICGNGSGMSRKASARPETVFAYPGIIFSRPGIVPARHNKPKTVKQRGSDHKTGVFDPQNQQMEESVMPQKYWMPTEELKQADWMDHYRVRIAVHGPTLNMLPAVITD